MVHLYPSAFLEALGWSLIDSLWKMGGLWVIYFIFTGNEKWHSAASRCSLAALMTTSGTVWSFYSIANYYQDIVHGTPVYSLVGQWTAGMDLSIVTVSALPVVATAYIILFAFFSLRLVLQYHRTSITFHTQVAGVDARTERLFDALVETTGVRKAVQIRMSHLVHTPLTAGFFKPIILLPVAVVNGLSMEQAETVIAHELFHVRRQDYLINLLVCWCDVILFFNPFSRLFRQAIQKEREYACDDAVIALGLDRWQYAHALFSLAKSNTPAPAIALAAVGNRRLLLERIRKILPTQTPVRTGNAAVTWLYAVARSLAAFFLCLAVSALLSTSRKTLSAGSPASAVAIAPHEPAAAQPSIVSVSEKRLSRPRRKKNETAGTPDHLTPALVKISPAPQVLRADPPAPTPAPVMINSFVSSQPEVREFTLVPPEAILPESIRQQSVAPVPFVPSSTFFYSGVEDSLSATGKTIVHL